MPSRSLPTTARARAFPAWRSAALAAALVSSGLPAWAAEYLARNGGEVAAAMSRAGPGDVVVLENGIWRDQVIEFNGNGAPGRPIILRPRKPGGVKLEGGSRLEISGRWLQVEGLRFEGGSLAGGVPIVQFRGKLGEATNSRFTQSAIVRYNPPDPGTRYPWVSLYGQNNRVDYNRFEGQNHAGVTVAVIRKEGKVDNHVIDHNYFVDRPRGAGNGYESIRIGVGKSAYSASGTRVESNLFERTDGEVETVSVKASGNVIASNTFREVAGTITLRRGSRNTVENNVFIGNGKPGTGGIRVTGSDHVVRGNLIQGVEGLVGGAISLSCGVDRATEEVEYDPVRRLRLSGNVIVDSGSAAIKTDAMCTPKRAIRPSDVDVDRNVIVASRAPAVQGEPGDRWRWSENEAEGNSAGDRLPPGLRRSSGLVVPGAQGVARSARGGAAPTPLTPADVGPSWWR